MSGYKIMRVLVLFDLPTNSKSERRAATQFRNFLLGDGFDMLQYSIYSRICPNLDVANKHAARVQKQAPKTGSVRVIFITEHQFANMKVLVGEKTVQEKHVNTSQLSFF